MCRKLTWLVSIFLLLGLVHSTSAATNPYPSNGATDVSTNVTLSWSPEYGAVSYDVYFGTYFDPNTPLPFIGNKTSSDYNPGTLEPGTTYFWRINEIEADGTEHTGDLWSFTTMSTPLEATNPYPADGAEDVPLNVTLSWDPGKGALMHDVYFGTSSPPPWIGKLAATSYDPGGLEVCTTYFWRVNEFTAMGTNPGPIWSFTTMSGPVKATNPSPADGAEDVPLNVTLSWDPGSGATSHDVYFGTSSSPPFIGNQTSSDYNPGTLEPGVDYYWRIDTVKQIGELLTVYTGDLWSFTTAIVCEAGWDVSNVRLNGGGTSMTVGPGDSVRLQYDFEVWNGSDVSYAIRQVLAGLVKGPWSQVIDGCVYNGIPAVCPSKTSGSFDDTFNAPTEPGTYHVVAAMDAQYTCDDAKNRFPEQTYSETVATITVESESTKASNPYPADGATDVPIDVALSWTAGFGATSHDVFFGTSSSPPFIANQSSSDYNPGTLEPGVVYYWRIDTVKHIGELLTVYTGDLWSFTTAIVCEAGWDVSNVRLNGGGTSLTVGPGDSVRLQYDFEVWNGSDVPGAIRQVLAGLVEGPWSQVIDGCAYNGIPAVCPSKTSGSFDYTFNAPTEPGTYQLVAAMDAQYTCDDAKNGFPEQTYSETVATITVGSEPKASNPYPADGATDVPIDVALSWTAGFGARLHTVYFGTSSPPALIGKQIASDYNPGTLEPGTIYYWQINEVVPVVERPPIIIEGDVWDFTTVKSIDIGPYIQEQLRCSACECDNYDIGYDMHISVNYGVVYTDVPVCQVHAAEEATIDFRLHYDSGKADGSVAKRKTVLGYGWTHNYNIHLIVAYQDVFMPDATGRMTRFQRQPDGSYRPSDGQTHMLSRIDSNTFLLEEVDGKKRTFEFLGPASWPTKVSLYPLTQIEDAQGRVTVLSYNLQGLLEIITDPYGRQVTLAYDRDGLIENITNADGTSTQIKYTDDNLSRITDALGYTLEYTYDTEDRIISEKLKDDTTWTCAYNNDGKPYQLIDSDGQVYGTVTNSLNWAIDEDRLQQFGELRYVPGQTTVTDGEGNITYCDYDENGYITRIYVPNHPGTIDEFDNELRLIRRTDEEANQWQYQYDAYGNRIRVTDPLGNETQMFYEHPTIHSLLTKNIEPDGDEWIYEHDSSGNLIRETDPIVDEPNDKVITHTYNSQGLRSSTTDRNGNVTQWEYSTDGTLARQTVDPNGLEIITEYEYDAAGRKTKQTVYRDPDLTDPVVTTYDYDAMGHLIKKVLDPNGLNLTTQYEYDGAGRKKNVTNPRAVTTSYEYDVRGRLMTETIDPNGLNVTTRYEYDNADNQTKLIDPKGNETRYEYDDLNRLVKAIDAEDYWTLYEYDERGYQTRTSRSISPGGPPHFVMEYRYDKLARRTHEIIDPCGLDLTTEFEYALPGTAGCACGTPGSSLVHKKTDPVGKVTYYYYDQFDRITSEVRKVGDAKDNGGDADDAITEYEYDYMYNRISVTVENHPKDDLVTISTYDTAGRVREQVEGPGGSNLTTTYVYDGAGNVIGQATPQGNLIISMYDKADRLISQSDSIGTVVGYTYDENGNILTRTDGLGHTWRYTYDNADRQIAAHDPQVESPTDKHASYEYDENGNLIRDKDNEGLVTEYTYDGLDRRIATSRDPCGLDVTITYTHDGLGNLTQITDDNGNTTAYEYDAANRKIREIYADGTDVLFGYDAAGNMTSRTDQMDNVTGYSYDDLHRLIARTYADGRTDTFTYDRAGRMLTADNDLSHIGRDYDNVGRVTSSTQTDLPQTYNYTITYDYNTVDNTCMITYPSGKQVIEVRDVRNRMTEVRQDGVKTNWYTYDDSSNRILTKNFANDTKAEYAYNDNDWVVGLRHIGPNGRAFAGFAHDYDAVGNRLNAINLQNVLPYDDAKPVTQSEMYSYDAIYRLVDFKRGMSLGGDIPWPTRDRTWQLDGVHNWTQFSIDGMQYRNSVNQMNEYDDPSTDGVGPIPDDDGLSDDFMVDQSASGRNFAHDKNGNLVSDDVHEYYYDYDHHPIAAATLRAENRLTMVRDKATGDSLGEYFYDALGRRIRKEAGGVSTVYVYTYGWRAIEEYEGGLLARNYTYDGEMDEPLTMDRAAEGDRLYYHGDALGSIVAITDATGAAVEYYSYDAWGTPSFFNPPAVVVESYSSDAYGTSSFFNPRGNGIRQSAIGNPYLFTGLRLDEETLSGPYGGLYYARARYYDGVKGRFLQRDPTGYDGGVNLYNYIPVKKKKEKIYDKDKCPVYHRRYLERTMTFVNMSQQDCKFAKMELGLWFAAGFKCDDACGKKQKCSGKCWLDKAAKKKGVCLPDVKDIKLLGVKWHTKKCECYVRIKCICTCNCCEEKPEAEAAASAAASDAFVRHEMEYWQRQYERQMQAIMLPQ